MLPSLHAGAGCIMAYVHAALHAAKRHQDEELRRPVQVLQSKQPLFRVAHCSISSTAGAVVTAELQAIA